MKRKVCVVIVSRANYARIKSVLKSIKEHPKLELQLVVLSSAMLDKYGDVSKVIEDDGFKISTAAPVILEGETPLTMARSTGLALLELPTIFKNLKPDIVLTIADRFETIAVAVAASYMNIPVAHTQGGEVTGSIDENVRHAVTKLSHIHLTTNQETATRLKRLGEDPNRVFITGCPAMDIIKNTDLRINEGFWKKYKKEYKQGVGHRIDLLKPYIVVLQHPVTTEYGSGLKQINETLHAIYELKTPTIWLWPNVDAGSDEISHGIRKFREQYNPDFIFFFKNFTPEDYITIINNSMCLVGNSSSAIREGSFLGVPAVNIGTRQEGRQRGKNIVDVSYDKEKIKQAIIEQIRHEKYEPDYIYGDGNAGKRIADILATCSLDINKKITY